ncbi:uncharacterized protein BO96DRAFT_430000 [Aspergillus niger CBS 101883]|uniref:uncharacterized protein n=1 Tax=Aspergillus lacticoffeatus (strain CBS 101883) TaxID=1450533 RepID=UPI000D7F3C92|nr:uncharacterized protein BO96DRAFT_430000 [Aspergillus niger CBS 101883]PYH61401.1 hypothetical protein BO96DRAFT_430000 [Aspergillus niger CBS 101883]
MYMAGRGSTMVAISIRRTSDVTVGGIPDLRLPAFPWKGRDIYVDRAFIGVNRKSIIRRKKKKIDPIQDAHSKSPIVMGYRLQAKECIFDYHIRYRSSFSLTQAISQLPTHLRLLPLDTLAEPALDKFNSGRPCNLSSSPGVSKPHVGQTIAVGVAILDEIDPLALHNIRNTLNRDRHHHSHLRRMSPEVGVDVALHSSSYPILGPVPGSCTAEIAKVFVDHGVGLTCVGGRTQLPNMLVKSVWYSVTV